MGFAESLALTPEDPPGLVVLDSGCTRAMHGKDWSEKFDSQVLKLGLQSVPDVREKRQVFGGVGHAVSKIAKGFPIGIGGSLLNAVTKIGPSRNHKNQCGYIVGPCTSQLTCGDDAPIMALETNSSSIKRVCRSTLAA